MSVVALAELLDPFVEALQGLSTRPLDVGVTGTQGPLFPEEEQFITHVIRHGFEVPPRRVVTGACVGVDALAARAFYDAFPNPDLDPALTEHRVVVPSNRSKVQLPDFPCQLVEMPLGSSYKQRNLEIVRATQVLLVFAKLREKYQPRSGTWQTARLGEDFRRKILTCVLRD